MTSAKVAIINCPEYIRLAGSSLILVLSMVSDFQKYWIRFSCYPGETEKFHDLHNLWKTGELRACASPESSQHQQDHGNDRPLKPCFFPYLRLDTHGVLMTM